MTMVRQKEKARLETMAFLYPHNSREDEISQGKWYSLAELLPAALERILLNSIKESNE